MKILREATAQQLGISLIPIREALKTLAAEGIVTYHPQRGYFVTELPTSAIADIYLVRDLLERQIEGLAIPDVTEQDIADMHRHLRAQARAVEEHDPVDMIATNRSFHFAIFDRCENPWLKRFVTQLWDTLDPYRVLSYRRMWLADPERHVPAEILQEHERILAALERHDSERALKLLQQHRNRSETFLRALVHRP
jgi:DNA-binding GntR family transcriptional regulator